MKLINAERKVHMLAYDDAHEENVVKYMTVEELLDEFTDEGCPNIISDPAQHGRWLYNDGETIEDGGYCSICGCDQPMFIDDWEWKYVETDYCPHCGSPMDVVNE